MADWNQDIAPRMRKIIEMLQRSTLSEPEKLGIRDSVSDIFLKRPKTLPGTRLGEHVIIEDEEILNFNLSEWMGLHREFMSIEI